MSTINSLCRGVCRTASLTVAVAMITFTGFFSKEIVSVYFYFLCFLSVQLPRYLIIILIITGLVGSHNLDFFQIIIWICCCYPRNVHMFHHAMYVLSLIITWPSNVIVFMHTLLVFTRIYLPLQVYGLPYTAIVYCLLCCCYCPGTIGIVHYSKVAIRSVVDVFGYFSFCHGIG